MIKCFNIRTISLGRGYCRHDIFALKYHFHLVKVNLKKLLCNCWISKQMLRYLGQRLLTAYPGIKSGLLIPIPINKFWTHAHHYFIYCLWLLSCSLSGLITTRDHITCQNHNIYTLTFWKSLLTPAMKHFTDLPKQCKIWSLD